MLYRLLSSLKTSVYILAFMGVIFLVGTIFPQGENIKDYIKAGGKYVAVVRAMDFLDVFGSPLFFIATVILLANLAVCLYDRFRIFMRIRRIPMDFQSLKKHRNVAILDSAAIDKKIEKEGFKLKEEGRNGSSPRVKIYEKGLQFWWLSWCYHVGIILAISGFFLTFYFAFEKDVLLYPGKPETISLYSKDTRWNQLLERMGQEVPDNSEDEEYVLTLKEFSTEYFQGLKLDYPKEKMERLLLGIGIKKLEPSEKGFSFMPKMWLTSFNVERPGGEILDAELWVNKPFRTGALTLYQMGYEQKVKLSAVTVSELGSFGSSYDAKWETINAETRVPFQVKNIKGKFVLGTLKRGTLFKKDGTTEEIIPVTTVYYIPEDDPEAREDLGDIELRGRLKAKGAILEFRSFKEGSYLSYRKDPGVWLVGLACLFVFLGLFVRSLGAWYRIQYASEKNTAYVLISTRGILADRDRIINKLSK